MMTDTNLLEGLETRRLFAATLGPVATADLQQIRTDRGNPTALVADQVKLVADVGKLRTDLQAVVTAVNADGSALKNAMVQDLKDLAASRSSPTLSADKDKLGADASGIQQTLR